jgi:hypothetical protein
MRTFFSAHYLPVSLNRRINGRKIRALCRPDVSQAGTLCLGEGESRIGATNI